MRRFTTATARASSRVLAGILKVASICFAKTVEDDEISKDVPPFEDQTSFPSSFKELNETPFYAGLEKASQQLKEMMTREPTLPCSRNMQLVPLSICSSSSSHENEEKFNPSDSWDTRSADEEIDISGLAPPLQPPRTFEVKNVRMERYETEDENPKRGFFGRMKEKVGKKFSR